MQFESHCFVRGLITHRVEETKRDRDSFIIRGGRRDWWKHGFEVLIEREKGLSSCLRDVVGRAWNLLKTHHRDRLTLQICHTGDDCQEQVRCPDDCWKTNQKGRRNNSAPN